MEKFDVDGYPFQADRSLFNGALSSDEQRSIFKRAVNRIVIETSSYCNRRCKFCPNESGLRIGAELRAKRMPTLLLAGICDALRSIDYDKTILLHLYNEPTADPDLAQKVRLIREKLPKPKISFNSNGDYLSREMLLELLDAGLTSLSVSLYGPNHGDFDTDYLSTSFERVFEIVGKPVEIQRVNEIQLKADTQFEHDGKRLPVSVFAVDFNRVGYDRAQSVGTELDVVRTSPCPAPFAELNIAWDGLIVPCCNIHPDHAELNNLSCGKIVTGEEIFQVFSSDAMRAWRRATALYGAFQSPCNSCTRLNEPGVEQTPRASEHNQRMQQLMDE